MLVTIIMLQTIPSQQQVWEEMKEYKAYIFQLPLPASVFTYFNTLRQGTDLPFKTHVSNVSLKEWAELKVICSISSSVTAVATAESSGWLQLYL